MCWKNFNEGSIPGFNQCLLNCFDMCNVGSGLVCVLFSTFVTGLTVESFSIYCACVSCVGKVVYNYLTCSFVLNSIAGKRDLGPNIRAKHRGKINQSQ